MYVSIRDMLEHPMFKDAEILAGRNGMDRTISRMSVFDCPINEFIIDRKIIEKGDFFISSLYQFVAEPQRLIDLVSILNEVYGSGLCITDENRYLITDEVTEFANRLQFPIIVTSRSIPYATIMDAVNQLIFMNYENVLKEYKVEKLLYSVNRRNDVVETVESINPHLSGSICVAAAEGKFRRGISGNNLSLYFLNNKGDCYIKYKNQHLFMFSDGGEGTLDKKLRAFKSYLDGIFLSPVTGVSSIGEKAAADRLLKEARLSLAVAGLRGDGFLRYESIGVMGLLFSIKDNAQLLNYYDTMMRPIREYDADDKLELRRCMREYVLNKGSYGDMASAMDQRINTLRYRLNKIRYLLNMDDDIVRFHETVALLVEIEMIIGG